MSERNFMDLLRARWAEGKFVCVGLDSDTTSAKFPKNLGSHIVNFGGPVVGGPQLAFNAKIVDATHDLVCAYKPNLAFYRGPEGKVVLQQTIAYIHQAAPGVPVILDAKYGDIGNTNDGYVAEVEYLGADAVTVHGYLGREAMKPFLDRPNLGVIVLVKTSNPGSREFQDLPVSSFFNTDTGVYEPHATDLVGNEWTVAAVPMYQIVAQNVARLWNANGNCAVVVGATYPQELAKVRELVGDMPILLPGIGAQGGDLEAAVQAGITADRSGIIVNSSRGIIFASSDKADFAENARKEAIDLHEGIDLARLLKEPTG